MSDSIFKDLEALKVSPEALSGSGSAREVLTQVPVRKPNRDGFIRTHPDPDMSLATTVYADKETRETFLVPPTMRNALLGEAKVVLIATAITRQHVAFLWPVPLPDETGRDYPWWESAREAYELAKTSWIRLVPDMQLGAYRIYKAEGELSEPKWPDKTFQDLLEIGFRGRIIASADHPVVKRLRGQL
jgi:hypothetical protein